MGDCRTLIFVETKEVESEIIYKSLTELSVGLK